MTRTNLYCDALGIQIPRMETAKDRPDANAYSLLIVALLERGEPITLEEAAERFEEAGVARADHAIVSLKKCRPNRAPIYRDGDRYALDPHDHETDLWAFRLDLRPPKAPPITIVRPDPPPLPSPDIPLTVGHLDEVWRDGVPGSWSAQRTAICVLDAHGALMHPDAVLAFIQARSTWSLVSANSAAHWGRGAPIRVRDDGLWELDRMHDAVRSARQAVRERVATIRRWKDLRPDPVVIKARQKHFERVREAHAERLARMSRVLVHAFPAARPEAVVLLDVARRGITTLMGDAVAEAGERLAEYEIIGGVDVRGLLRTLGQDPGVRRLAELGPPQKSIRLSRNGRPIEITLPRLVQGSCGISRPFAADDVLHRYLRDGKSTRLRLRLEADARSLFALYQYGRLHGAVRLRWRDRTEMIPVPWVHRDEPMLYGLMGRAHELGAPLEVVIGNAPDWTHPWSRAQPAYVTVGETGWHRWLLDEEGYQINEPDIQLARVAGRKANAGT